MEEIKNNTTEQDKEYEVAKAEAEADKSNVAYIHFFRKPFEWEGKEYKSLTFDFDKLTGEDSLSIEAELQAKGISVLVPAFSGHFLIRMAARVCNERLGVDAFQKMPMREFLRIRTKARNFLMESEQ
jgi:hypothetical protein